MQRHEVRLPGHAECALGYLCGISGDWLGHDCVLRGEACGTIDGSIVSDGAEIICKRKLMDREGFGGKALDDFACSLRKPRQIALLSVREARWKPAIGRERSLGCAH